jgi:NAD(P)-dependent dehydrogenase (short-subunit alcohol dehydrogenase family)
MQRGKTETVVITGASAGVGRATAQAFARQGARIGLLARGRERLEAAQREVEALGGQAVICVCDVADADAVEAAAARVEQHFGPIDVWVNNAMVSVYSTVIDMTPDEFRRVTEVTYLGCIWGTLAALRRMRSRNRGVIVQVGSALAYRGIPLQSAYCAAKHAIQGFNDSLRTELLHEKSDVRLCMVQLPALNTPQFAWTRSRLDKKPQPVPPIYQPEVAADAIVFAAAHNRRELCVGMPTVKAVVGNKIAPGFLDHFLARKAFAAQQTDEPADPNRPDNLMQPVAGDFGAHGEFDDRSRDFSLQWQVAKRSKWLWACGAVALAAGLILRQRKGET